MPFSKCPRCKQRVLDYTDCAESGIYGSQHVICNPCGDDEDVEFDIRGTNNLPDTLKAYGPPNDW